MNLNDRKNKANVLSIVITAIVWFWWKEGPASHHGVIIAIVAFVLTVLVDVALVLARKIDGLEDNVEELQRKLSRLSS